LRKKEKQTSTQGVGEDHNKTRKVTEAADVTEERNILKTADPLRKGMGKLYKKGGQDRVGWSREGVDKGSQTAIASSNGEEDGPTGKVAVSDAGRGNPVKKRERDINR